MQASRGVATPQGDARGATDRPMARHFNSYDIT